MAEICDFLQLEQNWSATGAMEAGRNNRAPRCNQEVAEISQFGVAPVGTRNWSRTGADWSSKGASAPVVYTPLKGGYNHNWSSAPVRLQNWSGEMGR
jgi:hypothetical protein